MNSPQWMACKVAVFVGVGLSWGTLSAVTWGNQDSIDASATDTETQISETQDPTPTGDSAATREAIIAELDAFRDSLFKAFNEGDYEQMLEDHCHPQVIATWQDGTAGQGFQAVLDEFDKLSEFINVMKVNPTTDLRLVLEDGSLVVAAGQMSDTYEMANGADIALESRWSATLVKQDDGWRLISFSATTDGFDNEVIDMFMRMRTYLVASIAGIVGLVVGVVLAKILGGKGRGSASSQS